MNKTTFLSYVAALAASSAPAVGLPDAVPLVLENDAIRAEIVPAWAGRLMYFGRPGGTNALWTWTEAARFTVDENGRPLWRNVGGEKTWVGSQDAGWRAFAGKKAGIVWPPPAWFDSMPMDVVESGPTGAVLRTDVHRAGDWAIRLERSFALCGDRLVVRQRLLPESVGALGPEALPDDDRRLWSVTQIPRPDRVFLHLVGEGRQVRDGDMPAPVPIDRPGWTFLDVGGMDGDGKLSADGDRLAVPLADGWLVLSQTAPARHLAAFATPGRAMVFASKPDERPSPYAELEFAAYGPDAEQIVEFRIADDPFGPDAAEVAPAWVPLAPERSIEPGSALDFWWIAAAHAPCGVHGRVVARDGHFEFEGLPGEPVRFWGVNISGGANFPDEDKADAIAAHLASLGYNAVRIHHHDGGLVGQNPDAFGPSAARDPAVEVRDDPSKARDPAVEVRDDPSKARDPAVEVRDDPSRPAGRAPPPTPPGGAGRPPPAPTTGLDPAALRRHDALVAACSRHGLYIITDLYVSRPVSWRAVGIDRDGTIGKGAFKHLVPVHDGAFSNFCAFAAAWLGHTNAFTGVRFADDPALLSVALINEGNLDNGAAPEPFVSLPNWQEKWAAWLAARAAPKDEGQGTKDEASVANADASLVLRP